MNIPLVNLAAQHETIQKEADAAVLAVLAKSNFILGDEVSLFEEQFAKYIGVKYCVGVANGTDAIKLMLLAAGIKQGDEVIVQANTFISSVLPIIEIGAKPVFVDCDEHGQLDVSKIRKAITKKTRAILPVHLYGVPMLLPKTYNLTILEDAAQAHGSSVNGKKCGSLGDMAAFSFYPGKNLGAYGDGGAVTTNNKKLAEKLRIMRNIGQKEKYNHVVLGFNSRLDTIQAAVLSVKLKHLEDWNKKRNAIANTYIRDLHNVGDLILPTPNNNTNWHLFVIRTYKRDDLMHHLEKCGIHCGIHYPVPLHTTPALKFLGYKKGDFPIAEMRAKTMISLPIYAELKNPEVQYMIKTIKNFFTSSR